MVSRASRQAEAREFAARYPDLAAQLTQLGALHASGVLSDAEFSAAKARNLGTEAGPQDEVPRAW